MERVVAVTVLVLVSPHMCRQLPHADRTAAAPDRTAAAPDRTAAAPDRTAAAPDRTAAAPDRTAAAPDRTAAAPDRTAAAPDRTAAAPDRTAAAPDRTAAAPDRTAAAPDRTAAAKRFNFLATPNIATSLLTSSFITHETYPRPEVDLPTNLTPFIIRPSILSDAVTDKRKHHNVKHNDERKYWTQYPHKKHLVEIVPIRHKSKVKGEALAYILPQSDLATEKLNKKKRISGIVVNRIPNINDFVFGSSEEDPSAADSHLREPYYDVIDTSEELDTHTLKPHPHTYDKDQPELKINKVKDIVSYIKDHKVESVPSIVHKVTPSPTDPDYHVHYVLHAKHTDQSYVSNGDDPHYGSGDVIQESPTLVQSEPIYIRPASDADAVVSGDSHLSEIADSIVGGELAHTENEGSSESSDFINGKEVNEIFESDDETNHEVIDMDGSVLNPVSPVSGSQSIGVKELETGHITIKDMLVHDAHSIPDITSGHRQDTKEVDAKEVEDPDDDKEVLHPAHVTAESSAEDTNTDVELDSDNVREDVISQSESDNSSFDSGSVTDDSDKSTNDLQPNVDSLASGGSLESNLKDLSSSESVEFTDDHSNSTDVDDDHSSVLDPDDVPHIVLHAHGDVTSGETVPEGSMVDTAAVSNESAGEHYITPDCFKTNKQKVKCDNCSARKSYKLTFLFHR